MRLDAEVYAALEQWAEDEFRSVNGQIEWIFADALRRAHRHPKQKPAANTPKKEE